MNSRSLKNGIEFHTKLRESRAEGEYPDHIFRHIGDETAGKLVEEHKQEQRKPVIIRPDFRCEEKYHLDA